MKKYFLINKYILFVTLFILILSIAINCYFFYTQQSISLVKNEAHDITLPVMTPNLQSNQISLPHKPFTMKKMLMCQMITSHMAVSDLWKDTLTTETSDARNITFSLVFNEDGQTLSRAANRGEPILSGDHTIIQQDENTLIALRKSVISEVKPKQINYEYILLSKTTGTGIIYTGDIYSGANDNILATKIANYFQCE